MKIVLYPNLPEVYYCSVLITMTLGKGEWGAAELTDTFNSVFPVPKQQLLFTTFFSHKGGEKKKEKKMKINSQLGFQVISNRN